METKLQCFEAFTRLEILYGCPVYPSPGRIRRVHEGGGRNISLKGNIHYITEESQMVAEGVHLLL